ncbi:MAG: LamG-like jellyroll fold domain-containing protein [Bacteroidota bacterium]
MLSRSHLLFLLFFASALCADQMSAQSTACGVQHIHDQMKIVDPGFELRVAKARKRYKEYLDKKKESGQASLKNAATYTIPIVFHVIYTSEDANNNISDEQLISSVERLNEIYANADGNSVNTGIQFQIATMDEFCQPTTGINRVSGADMTNYSSHGIDNEVFDTDGVGASLTDIFGLSRWNPDVYMNVYIVSEIGNNNGGYGTQGYAFYPTVSNTYHGIVVMYNTIGYDYDNCDCYELKSYTDENSTLVHEVGHYLNLKHTFEGGDASTCPSTDDDAGDEVADTPAHKYITNCSYSGGNTCYASTHEYYSWEKIIHNYMGYAGESCYSEFTEGQTERMIAALETIRPSLLHSPGIQTTATNLADTECSPQTSATGTGGEYGVGPIYVKIGGLEASSGSAYDDGGYIERLCFSADLEINQTYDLQVNTHGNYNEDISVYIDWDNNGAMDEDELVFSDNNGESFSGSFSVPVTAAQGQWIRARVITDHKQNTISSSCYTPTYGQVEDYPVYIVPLETELTVSPNSLSTFLTTTDNHSASQSIDLSGIDLLGEVSLSIDGSAFELSENGSDFSASLSLLPDNMVLASSTVYVRLKSGLSVDSYSATLTISTYSLSDQTLALTGAVGEISKERGNAIAFDGNGDAVETNFNAISGGQSRTFEAWVKPDDASIIFGYGINSSSQKWVIRTDGNGRLRAEINGASKVGTTVLTDGSWHHIAVVLDNTNGANLSNTTLYVNGMEEDIYSSSNVSNTINTNASGTLTIGKDMANRYFQGSIDEARVWSIARTANEIRENMHLTLQGDESGLAAYYQFNESTGAVYDWVGASFGSLAGDAYFTSSAINCGREGESQTIGEISSSGMQSFDAANLEIEFIEKTSTHDFTATYQEFAPNTTGTVDGYAIFNSPVWTINHSSTDGEFLGHFAFVFPANTLGGAGASYYALYHRSMNSDGDWSLLKDEASSADGQTITFDSIGTTGQFMVVQTQEATERGLALQLDGIDDLMEIPFSFNPTNDEITIECWINISSSSEGCQTIFDSEDNLGSLFFMVIWNGSMHIRFGNQWAPISLGTNIGYAEWNHIAFTWDRSSFFCYLNGIEVGSGDLNTPNTDFTHLKVGGYKNDDLFLNAQMEELKIWTASRTQTEILESMHLTATAKSGSTATYFQFNQGSSDSTHDVTSSITATIYGDPIYSGSGVNVGETGAGQWMKETVGNSFFYLSEAKAFIECTSASDTCDFYLAYQSYAPNTTEGIAALQIYQDEMWTLHQLKGGDFSFNIQFYFVENTFTDLSPDAYSLYRRSTNGHEAWELLKAGASDMDEESVTFEGISQAGQFIMVKN